MYKCRNEATRVEGAKKILLSPTYNNLIRFQREIQILTNLYHENIIKILDWNRGESEYSNPWYVMEYMEGVSLEDLIM